MIKNAFYFILKGLFILKIFKFLSWLSGHQKKWFDLKYKVNFKIYDVTTWLTNNYYIYIAHISQSKDNQAMKFGQLIKCNMGIIFLQKSCRKWGKETSSRPLFVFWKKLYEVKAGGLRFRFNTLDSPQLGIQ